MKGIQPIRIHEPRVESYESSSRLSADVEFDGKTQSLFFEVDKKYETYLTPERPDAFVLLMLVPALCNGQDIVCDTPMTSQLHHQLNDLLIPVVARYIDQFSLINIACGTDEEIPPVFEGAVTAVSGGVDSFYTIFKKLREQKGYRPLTHLVINNVGALTKVYDSSRDVFARRKDGYCAEVAEALKLDLLAVNTNIVQLLEGYPEFVNQPDNYRNAACAFAVKKLIRCYYMASAVDIDKFEFSWEDSDFYNPLVLHCLTTSQLQFETIDWGVPRGCKFAAIVDEPLVRRYLNVCGDENDNCCFKCTRTMFELYAMGKLDDYGTVFDVDWFKRNLADRLAFTIADPNERAHGYPQESLAIARRGGVRIPAATWLLVAFKYWPLFTAKKFLAKNEAIKRFYHEHDLRNRLFGKGKRVH